jgi:hypothetical protein
MNPNLGPSPEAARKRRYRQRVRDGKMTLTIEVDATLIDFLALTGWLERRQECFERAEIAAAIERMLHDAARG